MTWCCRIRSRPGSITSQARSLTRPARRPAASPSRVVPSPPRGRHLTRGASSTLQFQATISNSVQAGQTLTNTATGTWTSLPGPTATDLSIYNTNSRERTGSGGVNDYVDTGAASVSVNVVPTKSLVATSEASTVGSSVAVGEIVRYHLTASLPEGSAPDFQLVDALPAGLQYLDDGTARFTFVSNGLGITSSTLGAGYVQTGASGALTPNFALPAGVLSGGPFADGTDPVFRFGNLANSDNDADAEYVIVEFNALVLNVPANVAGATRDNSFTVRVAGAQVGSVSNVIQTSVVEPAITDVAKTALPPATGGVDAGQVVTFSVTYSNPSSATAATAFDARLTDSLPSGLTGVSNLRVFRNGSQIATGFVNNSTASTLDVTVQQVAAGDRIEIRYDATVTAAVLPGAAINNLAQLTYSSLPGAVGTVPNPTGSVAGAAGTSNGERNGSGGVNTYIDSDGETLIVQSHSIAGAVYRDDNNNGLFDEGAGAALAGVIVSLTGVDHLGNAVSLSVTTNAAGAYSFGTLRPGSYTVTQMQPPGMLNGRDTLGTPSSGSRQHQSVRRSPGNIHDCRRIATGQHCRQQLRRAAGGAGGGICVSRCGQQRAARRGDGAGQCDGHIDRHGRPGCGGQPVQCDGRRRQLQLRQSASGHVHGDVGAAGRLPGRLRDAGQRDAAAGSVDGPNTIGGIVVGSGQTAGNNNFGDVPPSIVSGRVFVDHNNSGTLNGSDAGLGGVTVTLSGTDVNGTAVSRSTVTAADGSYSFANLWAGTYTLAEPTQPSGYFDGQEARGGVLLAGSIGSDTIGNIVVGIGATSANHTFAEVPPVNPTGYVYVDANNNGTRDAGETGIPGVTITLSSSGLDVFGNVVAPRTAVTNAAGYYQFANLPPALYTLTETQPAGFLDGREQNGTPAAAVVNNDQFVNIDLTNTTTGGDYNFGELQAARVAGFVYLDADNNGLRGAETGLGSVTVTLTGTNDLGAAVNLSSATAADGSYSFGNLRPGTYTVTSAQPAGYLDGYETRGNVTPLPGSFDGPNTIGGIVVGSGQTAGNNNFGDVPPSIVSGRVFVDHNNSGTLGGSDAGLGGVTVTLSGTDVNGTAVSRSTVTAADGSYSFSNLWAGTYTLAEPTQPSGYFDGQEARGGVLLAGSIGSDTIGNIVVGIGATSANHTFAEVPPVDPTGYVYVDANNNGTRDAGEVGIPGVTITLSSSGLDVFGNVVVPRTAVTNAAGYYQFANLPPALYTLTETQPAGFLDGREQNGTPPAAVVNNDQFVNIDLTNTTTGGDYNFGELQAARVTGFVYLDADNNGLRGAETGLGSVTVTLTGTDDLGAAVNLSSATAADGSYSFGNLRPGTYTVTSAQPAGYLDGYETRGNVTPLPGSFDGPNTIGGIVVGSGQTAGNNNFGDVPPSIVSGRVFVDHNNSGTLNGSDAGLGGVTVTLSGTDVNGTAVSRSTVTAADGSYSFANLWAGTYTLAEPTQPSGYFDGQEARGGVLLAGSIGSDTIGNIVVGIGATSANHTFAEVPPVDPTGYVYVDANNNGTRDAGEMGIPGVTITLSSSGLDVFGNVVAPRTAVTNAAGYYQFANLPPALYTLTETQPAGFLDGREQNGTPPAAVVNNDQFVDIDLTNTTVGGDYNFGELSPSGSLSGSTYIDANNNGRRDSGEIGLAGVRVTIVSQNDPTMTATVVTDAQGNYRFVKMFPGTYRVTAQQPINFLDGRDTAGSVKRYGRQRHDFEHRAWSRSIGDRILVR